MFLVCSLGKSQEETLEKDFFFLKGGCGALRTRGSGGGGGRVSWSWCPGREGGREEVAEEGEGVVNVAEASEKDFRRAGMWTVSEGAVRGRWVGEGVEMRLAKEGAMGGMGTVVKEVIIGAGGIGSGIISFELTRYLSDLP